MDRGSSNELVKLSPTQQKQIRALFPLKQANTEAIRLNSELTDPAPCHAFQASAALYLLFPLLLRLLTLGLAQLVLSLSANVLLSV